MTNGIQVTQATARVQPGKRAAWMKSSNSHISPATDVEVSIQLLCADLNKKNVTIAQKWDILHACEGIKRHSRKLIMSNRKLKQAWQMRIMKIHLDCTQYTQLQMVMKAMWLT